MAYIARTDGGHTVLEMRAGTLSDIPESERANWRPAYEVVPNFDGIKSQVTGPTLTVNGDGSQVNIIWSIATADAPWAQMRLRDYAAQIRYQKEIGGLTLPDGTRVATDRDSQSKISQALTLLEKGWVPSISWKTASGWVPLDVAAMTLVAQAVAAHVQGCFAAEQALVAAIDAGTVTTSAEVLAWEWP